MGTSPGATSSDRAVRLLTLVGACLAVAFLVGAVVPRHPDLDPVFGAESYRRSLVAYGVATAAALCLLLIPSVGRRVADAASGLGTHIPAPQVIVPVAAGLVFFFALPTQRLSGDGTSCIWFSAAGRVYPSNALTGYLHLGLAALPGVTAHDAVRLADALSGAVYVFAALGIARECFEDGSRRAAMAALLLTTGSVALFFGSIEVYAPLAAAIAVYLLVGTRFLSGRGSGVLPPLALGVAFTLHGSAGLLLPSLWLLANSGTLRPLRVRRWLAWGGLFLLPLAAVFGALWLLTWGGEPPTDRSMQVGSFLGALGQSPLLPWVRSSINLTHRYAVIDIEHLLGVLNLWFLATPVGLGLLAVGWRGWRRTPRVTWVASAVAFLAAYPILWNVSYSLRRDWDLFSSLGAPLALLAGLTFLEGARSRRVAVGIIGLALYGFVPFVVANTGTHTDRLTYAASLATAYESAVSETSGEQRSEAQRELRRWRETLARLDGTSASLAEAGRHSVAGREADAERIYRRVLDAQPDERDALLRLGSLLARTGRRAEARRLFERAVRVAPEDYRPRFLLAETYREEGRVAVAIPILENAVRYATADTRSVLEALALLEAYWRGPGRDPTRADQMRRLADERRGARD